MRFSVVTVCYNAAGVLEQTMESVLGQTYADVEYIVVDGGSTDGSADIIRRYAGRLAWWCSEPDGGIYDAMNKGLARCTGRYVCFMNAGDRFASPTVLAQVAAQCPTATVLYGNTLLHEFGVDYVAKPDPMTLNKLMRRRMPICHQSVFVDVDYHKNHKFDLSYRSSADYNLFYNALLRDKVPFEYIDEVVSEYDAGCGFSKSNMKQTFRERYRIWGIEDCWMKKLPWEIMLRYRQFAAWCKRVLPPRIIQAIRK